MGQCTKMLLKACVIGNLSPRDEREPMLCAWTTMNRSGVTGIQRYPLKWNEQAQRSSVFSMKIDVPASGKLRPDDAIVFELLVKTENHEGRQSLARTGSTTVFLRDMCGQVAKSGGYKKVHELAMSQFTDDHGQPYIKGVLDIRLENPESAKAISGAFGKVEPYHLVPENFQRIKGVLMHYIEAGVETYQKKIGASAEDVKAIHYPALEGSAQMSLRNLDIKIPIPIVAYTFNATTDNIPDEVFMRNLIHTGLERQRSSRSPEEMKKWFVQTVDKQLASPSTYLPETSLAAIALVSSVMGLSVALDYKSDEVFVRVDEGWRKVPAEIFSDSLLTLADDCEGVQNVGFRVANMLARGTWNDPVLLRAQTLMQRYVPLSTLGSVTSAKLERGSEKFAPVIIDSDIDADAQCGGHMWLEFHPRTHVNDMFQLDSAAIETALPVQGWERGLPPLVGEGTGRLNPFVAPMAELAPPSDKQMREMLRSNQEKSLRAQKLVMVHDSAISLGAYEQVSKLLDDVEGARLSEFYRRSSEAYTDYYIHRGLPICHLVWVDEKTKKYGVNTRYRIGTMLNKTRVGSTFAGPSEKTAQQATLRALDGPSQEELRIIGSIMRQFSPTVTPALSLETIQKRDEGAAPIFKEFVGKSEALCQGRMARVGADVQPFSVHFKNSDFFTGKIVSKNSNNGRLLRECVLDDIKSNAAILQATPVLEHITDDLYNVRLELLVDTSHPLPSSGGISRRVDIATLHFESGASHNLVVNNRDVVAAAVSSSVEIDASIRDTWQIADVRRVRSRLERRYGPLKNVSFKRTGPSQFVKSRPMDFEPVVEREDPAIFDQLGF